MKRQDTIRILVIACVTIAALGILVPEKAPATNPMQGVLTTTVTTNGTFPGFGPWNFTVTFTFYNLTETRTSTSYVTSGSIYISRNVVYTVSTTVPITFFTTTTTYTKTQTSGTTIVPSTFTTLTGATAITTNRTVTATESQTVTSTSYTTESITTTSIYVVTGASPPTLLIPGFPLESIIAGLLLGLVGVSLIYRKRRANREVSA